MEGQRRSLQPRDAVIVDYVRTPFGRHGGALAACGQIAWPATSSRSWCHAPASTRPMSMMLSSGAPTRPARTTATWPAWRAAGRLPGRGARPDGESAVRVRAAGCQCRRAGDLERSGRYVRGGRRGEYVARTIRHAQGRVGVRAGCPRHRRYNARLALPAPEAGGGRRHLLAGRDGRERGPAPRHRPCRPGQLALLSQQKAARAQQNGRLARRSCRHRFRVAAVAKPSWLRLTSTLASTRLLKSWRSCGRPSRKMDRSRLATRRASTTAPLHCWSPPPSGQMSLGLRRWRAS